MAKKSKKTKTTKTKKQAKPVKKQAKKTDVVKEAPKTDSPSHLTFNKKDNPKSSWYVVHTYSGHEHKVAANLAQRVKTMKLSDRIFEVMIPTQEKIQIKRGKKETIKEKIFPGYMLIKLIIDDNTWLAVRTTPGITGFVGTGTKPTPLPPQEVATIMKFSKQAAPKFKTAFSVGDAVKITEGPFADFLGAVDYVDEDKGKVRILVSIFGRETPVELDFLQVQKI